MKPSVLVTAFLFWMFFMCTPWAKAAGTLVWVTDNTPGGHYIVGGGTGFDKEKPGIEIELYRMVAKILGFELKFQRLPWNRCLELIRHNRVDGIFPASFKPSRMEIGRYPMAGGKVDPSRKTRNNAYFLYALEKTKLHWNGKGFTGKTDAIGAPLGWSIVADLKEKGVMVKEIDISEQTPGLLINKRLDGFVCLETVFDAYLKKNPRFQGTVAKIYPPIKEKPYYLMLSHEFVKAHPLLSEKIWNTIREIKHSDDFVALVSRYIH